MGRRGPKPKRNVIRKWWRIHKVTLAQIAELEAEIKGQLPLLENTISPALIVSVLVSRCHKELRDGLFDATEFVKDFHLGDDESEEELVEEPLAQ